MKKLIEWCKDNTLLILTFFLLAFIPLYPKIPLVDIRNTWVYIRIEDILVLVVLSYLGLLIFRKKIDIKTPLTLPLFAFWLAGAIATIHGMLLIFPSLPHVYPNVVFLSLLRRIEYMSVFFIAFHAVKNLRIVPLVTFVLTATVFIVAIYGLGQKYFGFYAFLTMNEEFAKGIPIQLSNLSRISSTFAGHYDLAAYLVLMLPILVSMMFAFKHWLVRVVLALTSVLGFIVLFMTVSRISLFALFVSLGIVLLFQKKKIVLFSIPVILLLTLIIISVSPTITDRFGNTIKQVDVLVDANTGEPIAHINEISNTYFIDKTVTQQFSTSIHNLSGSASPSAKFILPYTLIPSSVVFYKEPDASTGEDLPSGTGYINLALSPVTKKLGNFYFEPKQKEATTSALVYVINGSYLVKKVLTYDISFTTRFQGEWPSTLLAFRRNIFIGSGYGSVGLAVDNSYLRMLGEVGLLGFGLFLFIFIIIGLSIRNVFPYITSPRDKSFIVGFIAGVIGLGINAVFIDVFEASKIAFSLWLLAGIVMGIIQFHKKIEVNLRDIFMKVITSTPVIVISFLVLTIVLYASTTKNYFVGDDFTWFRWAAESGQSKLSAIFGYFTQADGFFYRPGTKIYFEIMYSLFWLNQTVYHAVSIFLHFIVGVLVFLLAKKICKGLLPPVLAGFLFLLLSGNSESIHWISVTGHLLTASFSLFSLLCYIAWQEKKKHIYFIASAVSFSLSLLFHESGLVTPLFFILYRYVSEGTLSLRSWYKDVYTKLLLIPVPLYLLARFFAQSHWFNGDYSYNIVKFPLNALGNTIGYFVLSILGPVASPLYLNLRNILRNHLLISGVMTVIIMFLIPFVYKQFYKKAAKNDKKIFIFGLSFFLIALLPFLGLGNMSSRYNYVASVGVVFLLVLFLKKFYAFFSASGRTIALGGTAIVMSVFCLFQLIQLQKSHADWDEAGKKSKQFIVAIEGAYEDYWGYEPMELHLVNVPIRSGEAWVFPVGIPDALWLIFHNPKMAVFSWPTIEAAHNSVGFTSQTKKIFEFTNEGTVVERRYDPIRK